ncbi:hypothetical protein RRF57_006109 [Xylaria bambusicola]|uniref:Uncharacterized protein n=1 Tax=Xylaria bambusicola TaxID=326684 RepID=A0AAN7UYX7_9PEZI
MTCNTSCAGTDRGDPQGIHQIPEEPVAVCQAEIIVKPVECEEQERLGCDTQVVGNRQRGGNARNKQLASSLPGDTSRCDRAPGLIDDVFGNGVGEPLVS